ncbi:MAG TPA: TIGR00159 family protein [Lachnospiraceae bacterium]|nr:TIGR00159 family protein [Lachnospiraceae bacterium]
MDKLSSFTTKYLNLTTFHIPTRIVWTDVLEVIILAILVYKILVWVRDTRAWSLLKGLVVILIFLVIAAMLNLTTILWIAEKILSVGILAVVIVLQPELRRALEQLGTRGFGRNGLMIFEGVRPVDGNFSDKTINEIIEASFEMGKAKTGALIVVEQNNKLTEYEHTGITVDAVVTKELLINIFEHNTPLHDGAVIIRGDRVVAATCYLPLSESRRLSKELGTRHRAGVGVSEVSDSLTVIISEETGKVSVAYGGNLSSGLDRDTLREKLKEVQNKPVNTRKRRIRKGGDKSDEKAL